MADEGKGFHIHKDPHSETEVYYGGTDKVSIILQNGEVRPVYGPYVWDWLMWRAEHENLNLRG